MAKGKTRFLPVYDKILLKRIAAEEKIGSLFIPDQANEKPNMGTVVEAGPGAVFPSGQVREMSVRSGDTILFQKYAGIDIELDTGDEKKEEFCIIEEGDVLGIVRTPKSS